MNFKSIAAIATLLNLANIAAATAQDYPNRPIRIVVPQAAGGATDVIARVIADRLSPRLRQQLVIDNKPGAGGNIAAAGVARAAPDGYTLLLANHPGITTAPSISKSPGFDPVKDFSAISMLAKQTMLLTVHPTIPVTNIAEFVSYARARPGALSYATPGIGSPHHLAMELFKQMSGVDLLHIPYKGGAPAMQDVVAGQVPVMFGSFVIAGPYIRAGRLRAIGASGATRNTQAPEYLTIAEQGYPGFSQEAWFGLVAPVGTANSTIERLNQEISVVLANTDLQQQLIRTGFDPIPAMSVVEFSRIYTSDVTQWSKVVRDAKILPE